MLRKILLMERIRTVYIFILFVLLLTCQSSSQAQNWLWAKNTGGAGSAGTTAMATDASGNVYIAGFFDNPGVSFGTTTLTSVWIYNMFLVKYDALGNVVWAKNEGGTNIYNESINGIVIGGSGNIYITGYFGNSTITFGTVNLTNEGDDDMFIVKYDTSGNVIWAKSAGGVDDDIATSINVDALENLCLNLKYMNSCRYNYVSCSSLYF